MKATIIGISRIEGVSDKSGVLRPYDIPRVLALVPVEVASKSDDQRGTRYSKSGYGFEVMEIDLSPDAIPQFSQVKYPSAVELEIGQRMAAGRLASVCTGLKAA